MSFLYDVAERTRGHERKIKDNGSKLSIIKQALSYKFSTSPQTNFVITLIRHNFHVDIKNTNVCTALNLLACELEIVFSEEDTINIRKVALTSWPDARRSEQ